MDLTRNKRDSSLEVRKLSKRFGKFDAVRDVSFSVGHGEIVGLLGPNGAGKTTTMQMLLGLVTPDSGSIRYFGRDFSHHRETCLSLINFASTYTELQHKLTVKQNLAIYAGLYGIPNAREKIASDLALLEVSHLADELFWKLSSGQKTRVILAKALLNRPQLLLLDEPTASLDPDISETILTLIRRLQKKHHVSMLITSHNMVEVERLCDRVLFLDHGRIVAEDTPINLTRRIGATTLVLTIGNGYEQVEGYARQHNLSMETAANSVVSFGIAEREIVRIVSGLEQSGVEITDIAIRKPSLEDVFLSIVKGTFRQSNTDVPAS